LQSVRDDPPPRLPNDGRFSEELQDFLNKCLVHKCEDRWTFAQLLSHKFLLKARFDDNDEQDERKDAERGLIEIRAIIKALYTHLICIQRDMQKNNRPTFSIEEEEDFDFYFGDLLTMDVITVLKRIVFSPNVDIEEISNEKNINRFRSINIKRLETLSYQLHVNVDTMIEEILNTCNYASLSESVEQEIIFNSNFTPKTIHDRKTIVK
jgi:serine/threonine protein kinase